MKPVPGFTDRFGVDLRRRRFLAQTFGSVAESFGFEPLEIPIVEHAAAYSEKVVGLSPWPEWNPRGLFELEIPNYTGDYGDVSPSTPAVLIPEGTLSVTRWLGDKLSQLSDPTTSADLPLKIYYEISCYRNELLNTITGTKSRQFTQFGIEILGSASICADLETMTVSAEALHALGVRDASIVFRISSNRLFAALSRESGLTHPETIPLKELLDTIGECKAGKRPERLAPARTKVLNALERQRVPKDLQRKWIYIIDRSPAPIRAQDIEALGRECGPEIDYLDAVSSLLRRESLTVDVDFCVVRSHEYYTGITFEIDLLGGDGSRHVEVGGGGRYDRLLGNFVESAPGVIIPSTGYAFGLERLQLALVQAGHLSGSVGGSSYRSLSEDAIARYPFDASPSQIDTGARYLATIAELRNRRLKEPVSVAFDAGDRRIAFAE